METMGSFSFAVVLALLFSTLPIGPETAPFDWMIGEWKGARKTDKDDGFPMHVVVAQSMGGPAVTEDLTVKLPNKDYRSLSVIAFDSEDKLWRLNYINGVKGRMAPLDGSRVGDAWEWRSAKPDGTVYVLRFERHGPDRWIRAQRISHDGGKTWSEMFTDRLERVR